MFNIISYSAIFNMNRLIVRYNFSIVRFNNESQWEVDEFSSSEGVVNHILTIPPHGTDTRFYPIGEVHATLVTTQGKWGFRCMEFLTLHPMSWRIPSHASTHFGPPFFYWSPFVFPILCIYYAIIFSEIYRSSCPVAANKPIWMQFL